MIESRREGEVHRRSLRELAESYQDGLRAETRRRILVATRQAVDVEGVGGRSAWRFVPQLAAAAAVALLLAAPALYREPGASSGDSGAGAVEGLEVRADGDRVVLTWDGEAGPRRLVKATSREQLSDLSRLPYQEISGGRWVDNHPEEAPVVYYVVQ